MSTIIDPTKPAPEQAAAPRLTRQSFEQIAANYTRLIELRNATVHGVNREAEIRGLIQSLSEDFINHAPEFLGVWEVVRSEYEPLINNIVSVFRRVRAVSSLRDAIDQQQAQVPKEAPKLEIVSK
jgi:hypothetical protein